MDDWAIVRFSSVPALPVRQAMIRWAQQSVPGRFIPFSQHDGPGRHMWGVEFQRAADAALFRHRWPDDTREAR
ncbi:MAG TPA: hypothetical protein VEY95_01385 [Azospirillaceae bacterium]|nr:hypothetical protein [Azospirillaceae bacterium]